MRFAYNAKANSQRRYCEWNVIELRLALNILIRMSQQKSFFNELNDLKLKRQLNCKSNLFNLNVFLDTKTS